jgi:hypothetical protein
MGDPLGETDRSIEDHGKMEDPGKNDIFAKRWRRLNTRAKHRVRNAARERKIAPGDPRKHKRMTMFL